MLLSGSAKFVEMNLQSSNVAKAVLAESDFEQTIEQGLDSEGCHKDDVTKASLKPRFLEGADKDDGIGVFKKDEPDKFSLNGIEVGDFKDSIEVVKMELRGVAIEATRDFFVYYKKKGLGNLNALDPDKCKSSDVTGCFVKVCKVEYSNTDKHCTKSLCSVVSGGGGGGPPPCYKVDDDSTTGKTLVGCGNTKDITATGTTAIGYNAGAELESDGLYNTFLGVGAGSKTETGDNSVFVGWGAGSNTTTGSDNTFIGHSAGYNDPDQTGGTGSNNIAIGSGVKVADLDDSNQINIGNIIKVEKQAVDPDDSTKGKIGVLKSCKADGSDCKALGKEHACPAGEFIREIRNDGSVVCESACSGGKRLFETLTISDPVTENPVKVVYDLRNPYTVPEGYTIDSRGRFCRCPGNTEFGEVGCVPCGAGEKKVFETVLVHKCMFCYGGHWVYDAGYGWQCSCPSSARIKKKIWLYLFNLQSTEAVVSTPGNTQTYLPMPKSESYLYNKRGVQNRLPGWLS